VSIVSDEVTHLKEMCVRMQKGQIHPAAIRSKNLIVKSLLNLMKEVPYSKITIKNITDRAVLTRRTFYAHFETKEDVINYHLSELNSQLLTVILEIESPNQRLIALIYFEFWMDHINLLTLIRKHQLLPLLFDNFEIQIKEMRSIFGCQLTGKNEQYGYYSSAFFAGILWNMLDKWIANGAKETPLELVQLLIEITQNFHQVF
jgi:AcrR family transcriptional regulator